MAWIIVSNDNENGPAIRSDAAVMDAHWAYELANKDIILAAGSLRDDDGVTKTGSLLVLDVANRDEAHAFFNNDPATKAGVGNDSEAFADEWCSSEVGRETGQRW